MIFASMSTLMGRLTEVLSHKIINSSELLFIFSKRIKKDSIATTDNGSENPELSRKMLGTPKEITPESTPTANE